jgi:phosphotriesterase-related protein
MTVTGPVPASDLGTTLSHEHVLVDFVGAAAVSPDRYDRDEVFEVMLPYLREIADLGVGAFFECTPAYLGRDPALLVRLSEATGLHMVTNTGYYGAGGDRYLPAHAYTESAAQLAERWIAEWENGIEGTGVRPGFIKIGVDRGALSEIDRKIAEAAAAAHLATGLTIACHTGEARAAMDVLDAVRNAGVDGSALVVVHADGIWDTAALAAMAEAGAWIELDGVKPGSATKHVRLVRALVDGGHADRILLSHDAGWYRVGEPRGGATRPYTAIFLELLPALEAAGLSAETVETILTENPARAFGIRVRPLQAGSGAGPQ